MIYLTTATEEDMLRILEIEQESISPPWTHGALLSEIYREDSFFAAAFDGAGAQPSAHCLIGFVILRRVADEGELFQIAIDKTARRRGVADMLMDAAFNYASESGIRSVYLEVRKSNKAAICLYKKHGFKSVRHRKNYFDSPVEDAIVMLRSF